MLKPVNSLTLTRESYPGPMDVAVSHAVLSAVANGEIGPVLRLHVPGSVLAFGRSDRTAPAYPAAVRAARAHGFTPVERLAGGTAAVFHESTIAFSLAMPESEPRAGINERFELIANIMLEAFESLSVDARIGEVPGEYCPGRWSINVGGRAKVMGSGQRLVRGAAHIGGVVVVDDSERIRDVLVPVYRALGLDWDPRTTGALADKCPGLDNQMVIDAIEQRFGTRHQLVEGSLPSQVIDHAMLLIEDHLPRVA